jgi:hypothetical protein
MLGDRLIFPSVRIRGVPKKVFEISIAKRGRVSRVDITDKTKRPPTHGLSEKQRWERSGLKPSGGLIDPKGME